MYMEAREKPQLYFRQSILFFQIGSLTSLKLVKQPKQVPRDSPVCASSGSGLQTYANISSFLYMGSGINQSPHVCKASALLTDLSSQAFSPPPTLCVRMCLCWSVSMIASVHGGRRSFNPLELVTSSCTSPDVDARH